MNKLSRYWKTVLAAIPFVTLVGGEIIEAINEANSDSQITAADWRNIAIAAVTVVLVYAKANTPPAGQPADPDISETDR